MNNKELSIVGTERLVKAIVLSATNEYRSIFRRRLYKKPISDGMEIEFDKLESFFESSWFTFLTNMDGSYIMSKLEQDERRKRRKKLNIKNEILI